MSQWIPLRQFTMNHTGFFSVLLGLTVVIFGLLNPKFRPMGITTEWFFRDRRVPNWPFRIVYCGLGLFLIYMGFKARFG